MNISPSKHSPQYPALAATLAGAAILTLPSCKLLLPDCKLCDGSGLMIRTATGLVPHTEHAAKNPEAETITCNHCKGTGVQQLAGAIITVADDVKALTR